MQHSAKMLLLWHLAEIVVFPVTPHYKMVSSKSFLNSTWPSSYSPLPPVCPTVQHWTACGVHSLHRNTVHSNSSLPVKKSPHHHLYALASFPSHPLELPLHQTLTCLSGCFQHRAKEDPPSPSHLPTCLSLTDRPWSRALHIVKVLHKHCNNIAWWTHDIQYHGISLGVSNTSHPETAE